MSNRGNRSLLSLLQLSIVLEIQHGPFSRMKTDCDQRSSENWKTRVSPLNLYFESFGKLIAIILAPHESQNGSTALYVVTSTPILLQTAKAVIYKPGLPSEKFLARLILDNGSQRSNVTTKVLRRWESIAG